MLTVEIDKERDLPALQALLNRLGLNYCIDDDDWGGFSEIVNYNTFAHLKCHIYSLLIALIISL